MATGLVSWSTTAASNATADANVNWAEGQAPSSVNDSARAMMASVAKWRDDNNASLLTGGTSTAYTLTTNQVFTSLAAMNRQSVRVFFNVTCGASPTLNVDGLGAKAINTAIGTAVGTGTIIANRAYDLVYDNSNSVWLVCGGEKEFEFATGTVLLFQQAAAPTGWTKLVNTDNAALRLVTGGTGGTAGGATGFTSVFAAGRKITQANLPNWTLANTLSITGVSGTVPFNSSNIYVVDQLLGNVNVTGATGNVMRATNGTFLTASFSFSSGTIGGSITSNGSDTGMDFNVLYMDVIAASKN